MLLVIPDIGVPAPANDHKYAGKLPPLVMLELKPTRLPEQDVCEIVIFGDTFVVTVRAFITLSGVPLHAVTE